MKDDLYLGRWRLIPELCLYQTGEVPESGIYEISEDDGQVVISVQWRPSQGAQQSIVFFGPPDGSRQPFDAPGVSELSISRISSTILDSSAYLDSEEVMFARRSVSPDGKLLSTVQAGVAGNNAFRNFQVYSRDDK